MPNFVLRFVGCRAGGHGSHLDDPVDKSNKDSVANVTVANEDRLVSLPFGCGTGGPVRNAPLATKPLACADAPPGVRVISDDTKYFIPVDGHVHAQISDRRAHFGLHRPSRHLPILGFTNLCVGELVLAN